MKRDKNKMLKTLGKKKKKKSQHVSNRASNRPASLWFSLELPHAGRAAEASDIPAELCEACLGRSSWFFFKGLLPPRRVAPGHGNVQFQYFASAVLCSCCCADSALSHRA